MSIYENHVLMIFSFVLWMSRLFSVICFDKMWQFCCGQSVIE